MIAFKKKLNDASLFRRVYIINLFFCYISFLQIAAYVFLVPIFIWGIYLVWKTQVKNKNFYRLRFGIWIGAFLAVTAFSVIINFLFNFSVTVLYSILFLIHISFCFFLFYGMHTERNFDFREELYFIARFIVYITTVINFIGIICLMFGVSFEWGWYKVIIYENRFTGCYFNPNMLGFAAVVSLVCCHMLYKSDFMHMVFQPRVSKIWIVACGATNLFSLLLCDSNASMVLGLGYCIVYVVYLFFADKTGLSTSKIIIKIISLVLVGVLLVGSSLVFRTICQTGFSVVFSKTSSVTDLLFDNRDVLEGEPDKSQNEQKGDGSITFSHLNENIDSGRTKLWEESFKLFRISPVIGISNGNIIPYSQKFGTGALDYNLNKSDIHNGYLTILVSTGALGFIIFAIFGFRVAKHSAQHLFLQKRNYRNDVYPCLFSFLFAYLIYALFERALLYDVSFMVMWFWLMLGYMGCYIREFEYRLGKQALFNNKHITRILL